MKEAERLSGKTAAPDGRKQSKALFYGGGGLLGLGLIAAALLRKRGTTMVTTRAAAGIAGFDIVRKLGQGGMGEVWEALDRALERRVAIKKLVPEIAEVPRERQRFLKEARTVAALKHPNIIEIHQVVENLDELYLVFEFVDGVALDSVLGEKGRLSLPEAVEVIRQTAAALDYAHGRGVIHQDLKPANVMVEDETVKIMDFGIARRVAETMGAVTRQEVVGTPSYMAPEQGLGEASPETDVFALGATLYEMLSGKRPFQGVMTDFSKLEKAYAPLSRVVPDLPEALDAVIDRALDPDPKRRFHSAGEMFAALEAAAGLNTPSA
jgi:serine/threonine-protein kinase